MLFWKSNIFVCSKVHSDGIIKKGLLPMQFADARDTRLDNAHDTHPGVCARHCLDTRATPNPVTHGQYSTRRRTTPTKTHSSGRRRHPAGSHTRTTIIFPVPVVGPTFLTWMYFQIKWWSCYSYHVFNFLYDNFSRFIYIHFLLHISDSVKHSQFTLSCRFL